MCGTATTGPTTVLWTRTKLSFDQIVCSTSAILIIAAVGQWSRQRRLLADSTNSTTLCRSVIEILSGCAPATDANGN